MVKRIILLILLVVANLALGASVILAQQQEVNSLKNEIKTHKQDLHNNKAKLKEKDSQIKKLKSQIKQKDATIKELDEQANTKVAPTTIEDMFAKAASTYGIDYKMLLAIAKHETGHFTSQLWVNNNNAGGMRYGNEWLSFPTQEAGIMSMAKNLKVNYIDNGLNTLEAIGSVYCPTNTEHWVSGVRSIMATI